MPSPNFEQAPSWREKSEEQEAEQEAGAGEQPGEDRPDRREAIDTAIDEASQGMVTPESVDKLKVEKTADMQKALNDIRDVLGDVSPASRTQIEENMVNAHLREAVAQIEQLDGLVEEREQLEQPPAAEAVAALEKAAAPEKRLPMERDPEYQRLVDAFALEYLRTKDAKWFNENYNDEVDKDGLLTSKDGRFNGIRPQMLVSAGFNEAAAAAKAAYLDRYPEKGEPALVKVENTQEAIDQAASEIAAAAKNPDYAKNPRMREELKGEPFVHGNDIHKLAFMGAAVNLGVHRVQTEKIIGTVSAFEDWGSEFEGRPGRVEKVAKMIAEGTEAGTERVFHPRTKGERIRVRAIHGPDGPLFIAHDGSHRIAGAKLAEAPEVLAEVETATEVKQDFTDDKYQAERWEEMIKAGLIDGVVTKQPDGRFKLDIKSMVLPWASADRKGLFGLSAVYEKQYPGSLDKLKDTKGNPVPKEIFTDKLGIAMNYFLAGRWKEYIDKRKADAT